MKRTMLQRQVLALSEDLREISEMLEQEEAEARRVANENDPSAPYRAVRKGEIKRLLEFVEERLSITIKALVLEENIGPGLT